MKPVFSPADEPDFDDQYENDDQTTRDIFDQSSSDEEDELIQPYSHRNSLIKPTHNFANDIKQKLSSLAADVVRTFGNSNSMNDEDLTRPLSVLNESSSKSSSDRNNENDSNKFDIFSLFGSNFRVKKQTKTNSLYCFTRWFKIRNQFTTRSDRRRCRTSLFKWKFITASWLGKLGATTETSTSRARAIRCRKKNKTLFSSFVDFS